MIPTKAQAAFLGLLLAIHLCGAGRARDRSRSDQRLVSACEVLEGYRVMLEKVRLAAGSPKELSCRIRGEGR